MMIGLGLTGAVAWMTAHSPLLPMLLSSGLYWALFVAELVMVFVLASRIDKIQATTATGLFVGYAVLNDVTLQGLQRRTEGRHARLVVRSIQNNAAASCLQVFHATRPVHCRHAAPDGRFIHRQAPGHEFQRGQGQSHVSLDRKSVV